MLQKSNGGMQVGAEGRGGERRGGEGGSLKMWVDSHGGRPSEDIGKWLTRVETKWRQWWCGVAVAVAVVVNLDRQIRRPTCRVGQVRRVHGWVRCWFDREWSKYN